MRRRSRALARRYGHSFMGTVNNTTAGIRKLAGDNPLVTAAVIGAGAGLVIAELGAAPAMAVGAVAAVAIEKATSK